MTWPLWMLAGATAYLVVGAVVGAIVDVDVRDALVRVLLAPLALLIAPLIWLATRGVGGGRFPITRLRRELDHWEHAAWGLAWRSSALVFVRRTRTRPPPAERIP